MKKRSKKQNQIRHALYRAAERFGLTLTPADLDDIRGAICKGKATFVGRTSLRVSIWDIKVRGTPCRVVYDRNHKTIVTFLPPEGTEGRWGSAEHGKTG